MFNMLVKQEAWAPSRGEIYSDRVFEHTNDELVRLFKPDRITNFPALIALPTLFVQESSLRVSQPARVGTIRNCEHVGSKVKIDYTFDSEIPPIPNEVLETVAEELDVESRQFSRTHWSVKNRDLFRVLLKLERSKLSKPTIFRIDNEDRDPMLISVMMPFDGRFDPVYLTLQGAVKSVSSRLRCNRADDIWEDSIIIQDVVSLINRSRIVIADCTDRNPNVFYEVGIAHTLGREVILITQDKKDIPFDLAHIRYVPYLNNSEGLAKLSKKLAARITKMLE